MDVNKIKLTRSLMTSEWQKNRAKEKCKMQKTLENVELNVNVFYHKKCGSVLIMFGFYFCRLPLSA